MKVQTIMHSNKIQLFVLSAANLIVFYGCRKYDFDSGAMKAHVPFSELSSTDLKQNGL